MRRGQSPACSPGFAQTRERGGGSRELESWRGSSAAGFFFFGVGSVSQSMSAKHLVSRMKTWNLDSASSLCRALNPSGGWLLLFEAAQKLKCFQLKAYLCMNLPADTAHQILEKSRVKQPSSFLLSHTHSSEMMGGRFSNGRRRFAGGVSYPSYAVGIGT